MCWKPQISWREFRGKAVGRLKGKPHSFVPFSENDKFGTFHWNQGSTIWAARGMKIDALHEVKQTVTPVIYRHLYSLYIQPVKVIYYDEAQGVCLLGGVVAYKHHTVTLTLLKNSSLQQFFKAFSLYLFITQSVSFYILCCFKSLF